MLEEFYPNPSMQSIISKISSLIMFVTSSPNRHLQLKQVIFFIIPSFHTLRPSLSQMQLQNVETASVFFPTAMANDHMCYPFLKRLVIETNTQIIKHSSVKTGMTKYSATDYNVPMCKFDKNVLPLMISVYF